MKQQDQITRQGDAKIMAEEAKIRVNALNHRHKYGQKLKKKQTQEINTMRFAAGQRTQLEIYATHKVDLGNLKGFKPETEEVTQQANHEKKNNPMYKGLTLEQQMEQVYGDILSSSYIYGTPHSEDNGVEEPDKRMVLPLK